MASAAELQRQYGTSAASLAPTVFDDGASYGGQDWYDALKSRMVQLNNQQVTPEQAAANRQQTAMDLAYSSPLAIPLGLRDIATANEVRDQALASGATIEDANRIRNAQAFGGLLGFAIPGRLPFGQTARTAAELAPSSVRIFAGPMAKTADRAALALAERMEAQGAHPDDIWRSTGWGRGADGKWRFEINDSSMGVSIPRNTMSGDYSAYKTAINHPDLFDAYPPMSRNRITFDHRTGDSSIAMDVNPNGFNGKKFDTDIGIQGRYRNNGMGREITKPSKVAGDVVHEVQHNVQGREGFSSGNDPFAILGTIDETGSPEFRQLYADVFGGKYGSGQDPAFLSALSKLDEMRTKEIYDQYWRTAGEVEARNAAGRLPMSAQERRATPPWATEDVPRDQQIVRFK